jgi:hypothetical protein
MFVDCSGVFHEMNSVATRLVDISLNTSLEAKYQITLLFYILKELGDISLIKSDVLTWDTILRNIGIPTAETIEVIDIVDLMGITRYNTIMKGLSSSTLTNQDLLSIKSQFFDYLKTLDKDACMSYLIAYAKYLCDYNQLPGGGGGDRNSTTPVTRELEMKLSSYTSHISGLQLKRHNKIHAYQFHVMKERVLAIECQFPDNTTKSFEIENASFESIKSIAKFFYNDMVYIIVESGKGDQTVVGFHYTMQYGHVSPSSIIEVPLSFDDIPFIDGDLNYPYCWYTKPSNQEETYSIFNLTQLSRLVYDHIRDFRELLIKINLPYKDGPQSNGLIRVALPVGHTSVNDIHIAYLCRESNQHVLYLYHCDIRPDVSSNYVSYTLTYLNHLKIPLESVDSSDGIASFRLFFLNQTVFYTEFVKENGDGGITTGLYEYDFTLGNNTYKHHVIKNVDASDVLNEVLSAGGRILFYLPDLPSMTRKFNIAFYNKNSKNDTIQLHFAKIVPFGRIKDNMVNIPFDDDIVSFTIASPYHDALSSNDDGVPILYIQDLDRKNVLVIRVRESVIQEEEEEEERMNTSSCEMCGLANKQDCNKLCNFIFTKANGISFI